jgi:hypothetical protein
MDFSLFLKKKIFCTGLGCAASQVQRVFKAMLVAAKHALKVKEAVATSSARPSQVPP